MKEVKYCLLKNVDRSWRGESFNDLKIFVVDGACSDEWIKINCACHIDQAGDTNRRVISRDVHEM